MSDEWKLRIKSGVRAFLCGCVVAVAVAAIAFVVGWIWSSPSWARGYEWQRRAVYVLGACGVLISGTGMFTTGGKTREEQLDPKNYERMPSMMRFPGISWAAALLWASFGVLAAETLIEVSFYALF